MKNEVISERQGVILIILFIIGSTFLIGSGGQAKQDAWIAVIIALSWSTILLLMFSRILSLYPGKDLFDILQIVMGKFIGKIISIIMIWFAFHLGTLVLRNLSEFTNAIVLPDTPVILPMVFFIILLVWGLREGIEVLGRWSEFFIWLVILIFIFTSMLSISLMDINRLKPILNNGLNTLLKGAFSSFSFPFGETVVFTMVFSNISKAKNYNKTFMMGLGLGGFIIFIATIRNLLVLGSGTISRFYFPSNTAISLIHMGELLQRLEMGTVLILLISTFIKTIICLLAVCNGISKVFGFDDYRFMTTPVTLWMFNFSFFIYKSTMEMSAWAFNIWPYYSMFFEVIIPLVIFILAEIRSRGSSAISVTK
ncbi:MAG: endospore germination permease [Clostridiaceae bacterium]|nr:endospore germination permease [Clostridiaceae bacterium]